MDSIDPAQLGRWLAATDIALLELRSPDGHVRLRRDGRSFGAEGAAAIRSAASDAAAPAAAAAVAPAVGIFLDRHPLRPSSLVMPGDAVHAGQTVALLRIGGLLLPVTAPVAGVAGACLAIPGATVGYGTPLIDIEAR